MIVDKELIRRTVIKRIRATLPHISDEEISSLEYFVDFGANSIDRTVIAFDTVRELCLEISYLEISTASSISELVNMIYDTK